MSFSFAGLGLSLAVLLPSVLLAVWPPRDGFKSVKVPVIFTVLERAGQVACLAAAMFSPLRVDVWLACSLSCLASYFALWARYFVKGRTFALLYAPLGPLPIPMAVFPVFTFLFAAASASSPLLGIAAVILAVGHWPTSLRSVT